MDEEKLIKDNIPYIEENNEKYFKWDDVKEKYKEVKTDKNKGIERDDSLYVLAENIDHYTPFDKSISKALNFKENRKKK